MGKVEPKVNIKTNVEGVNVNTENPAEIEKLDEVNQANTNEQSEQLIDDVSQTAGDDSKTTEEAEAKTDEAEEKKKTGKTVVVRYIGNGIWKDGKGELWASENKSANILNERQYSINEYNDREDIKFMVKYGTMKETYVK